MDMLQENRKKINEIDRQMAELFAARMEAVAGVAEYKRQRGLAILDSSREKELVARNMEYMQKEELRPSYAAFLQSMLEISKRYQHKILNGMKVAYCGVEGAFAEIAAKTIFPDGELVSCASFDKAYAAVTAGECDCCVLPIENSTAGEVAQVTDLIFDGRLFVNGVYKYPISQNLLAVPGTRLSDIKAVVSHPQALAQCADYISRHGLEIRQEVNTAVAARDVAQNGDHTVAAIASAETAGLYGLEIVDHDINQNAVNVTRFAVLSNVMNTMISADKSMFMLMFTVKNVAGALAGAIDIIGKHGFNLKVLRSRPLKDEPWQYYFYTEVDGDAGSPEAQEMLDELSKYCMQIKIAGRFSSDVDLGKVAK